MGINGGDTSILERYQNKDTINVNIIESNENKVELIRRIQNLNNPIHQMYIMKLIMEYAQKHVRLKQLASKDIVLPFKGKILERQLDTSSLSSVMFDLEKIPQELGNLIYYLVDDIVNNRLGDI